MEATMKQPKRRKKRQILSPQVRTDLTGYSFLLPNLIGCALFTFIPVLLSMFISFTDCGRDRVGHDVLLLRPCYAAREGTGRRESAAVVGGL